MGTKSKKPSVREELKNIKEEQKAKLDLDNSDRKKDIPNKVAEHKQPTPKKKKSKTGQLMRLKIVYGYVFHLDNRFLDVFQ